MGGIIAGLPWQQIGFFLFIGALVGYVGGVFAATAHWQAEREEIMRRAVQYVSAADRGRR